MNNTDVSVVLNMHREAPFLLATLRSLNACAKTARDAGLTCELIAVFDRPDDETRTVFDAGREGGHLDDFQEIKVITVDVGSLGPARNAGIAVAQGDFIWTADGDDLLSRNCIVELHRIAVSNSDGHCAVFCEYEIGFGTKNYVARHFDDNWLTIADLVYRHYYGSRIFAERSVFERTAYSDTRLSSGFAYEDWDFNLRLWMAGCRLLVAPGTIFFYRQRQGSLLRQSEAVSTNLVPFFTELEPKAFCEKLESEKRQVGDWPSFVARRQKYFSCNHAQEVFEDKAVWNFVLEASDIERDIDPERVRQSSSHTALPSSDNNWGHKLAEAIEISGYRSFTDAVLLPWLMPGGGEKYILQILDEISRQVPRARFLVLLCEPSSAHSWMRRLPANSVVVDLYNAFPDLTSEDRDELAARLLLVMCNRGVRLHIKSATSSHRMLDRFGAVVLRHFNAVYYRFCDDVDLLNGKRTMDSSNVEFLRRHLAGIRRVVCDCNFIGRSDRTRIGIDDGRYRTVWTKAAVGQNKTVASEPSYHLLWASRISWQKRPDLIDRIAAELAVRMPNLKIDVYGAIERNSPVKSFAVPSVTYRGSFDGIESLPLNEYDALLYTTLFDGLPNIILECMAAGLPVIAPDIGGIPEFVISGKTGILVKDDPDDAILVQSYADAVIAMYENWSRVKAMSAAAQARIEDKCGPQLFAKSVRTAFRLPRRASSCA